MLNLSLSQTLLANDDKLEECDGPYKNKALGIDYFDADLKVILDNHRQWIEEYGQADDSSKKQLEHDERRANLCQSILEGANFKNATLTGANLAGANLKNSNFENANLFSAKLTGAQMNVVNLENANLVGAEISGADLSGANLYAAKLIKANLENVTLSRANLEKADLSAANFKNSYLFNSNLSGVTMVQANFKGAYLVDTIFVDAIVVDTNLADADLSGANLEGAELKGGNLEGVDLIYTNVGGVRFQPNPSKLPNVTSFSGTVNLWRLSYDEGPHSLIALRKLFKEAGWRKQEREITYAIRHTEIDKIINPSNYDQYSFYGENGSNYIINNPTFSDKLDAYFKWIFFELTTQWGMNSGRALIVLLLLIPVFSIPYVIALRLNAEDGIWQDWSDKRARKDLGVDTPVIMNLGWIKAIGFGAYFSLLSAFNIGWRELNVGNWIVRIQPREYTLRATGWVRSVSGIQSLISVYLLAMWALTYFGRPFE